jgi:hypothetical protein
MPWLVGIGKAVLSFATSLASNALKWAAAGAFWLVGVRAKKIKNQEEIIDVLKKQRKILQQPELHRGELLERARKRLRER